MDRLFEAIQKTLTPNVLFLLGMSIFLLILSESLGKGKSQRTNAQFADKITKYNLCCQAISQLKKQKVKEVCLYAGSFKDWQINPIILWLGIFLFDKTPSLFVPTANPGIEVVGAPGMGKTFSIIDRLLMSAIEQGFSIMLYDFKGTAYGGEEGQIPLIGAYAARHKYKLGIFAPGRDYTCTINPLDFIRDSSDISMARTLAEMLHDNLSKSEGRSDNFFGTAGKRVLYSSFLLAKNTRYPDLAMAFAILQLPDLAKRLRYAREQSNPVLSVWNYVAFSQFMSFAQAGETAEGILGGAQEISSVFIQPDFLPCILGSTNVSFDLGKKEILIFQSNQARSEVFSPLMAAIEEMTVNINFSYQRKIPLVLSFDEYTTLGKIKKSVDWANWHRSKGLVMLVGYQNESQVIQKYGKEGLNSFKTGLRCKFIFNPMNDENAEKISKSLGEKEVTIENKSVSYGGGKSSKSTTISEQKVLTPLLRADEIGSMPERIAIYKNPKLQKGKRGNIPWKIDGIKVSLSDLRLQEETVKLWFSKILPKLCQREQARKKYDSDLELEKRLQLADEILPLPEDETNLNTSGYPEL